MCHQTTYTLPCEHIHTSITYCPKAPRASSSGRRTCGIVGPHTVPHPPPAGVDPRTVPHCPLAANCPYEAKGRCWNCCWCGKGWNTDGRCSCVMLVEGQTWRCEHLCCASCEAADLG